MKRLGYSYASLGPTTLGRTKLRVRVSIPPGASVHEPRRDPPPMTSPSEIFLSQAFSPATRLMIFAPYPDDEALGNGALIQLALTAGAQVRVVFLTDGDNNPWPQRAQERCWAIDSAARLRWVLRRRGESIRALQILGLRAEEGIFLGLPDQGLTNLWNRRDPLVITRLAARLEDFSPTLISVPSAADRHPDHRSGFALVQAALHLAGIIAPQWAYLISSKTVFARARRGSATSTFYPARVR